MTQQNPFQAAAQLEQTGQFQRARQMYRQLAGKHPRSGAVFAGIGRCSLAMHEYDDAERALRHFVIWSNLCYGSQSERGSRFAAYLMSVLETLRLRGWSVFSYIRQAILAGLHGEPPPKLLPAT